MITALCHCTECQKQTGTAFSIIVGVERDQFRVGGEGLASVTTVGTDSDLPVLLSYASSAIVAARQS